MPMSASRQRRTRAASSSTLFGSAKYSAAPPSRNQVCGASGSLGRTIFSNPLSNAMRNVSDVTGAHRHQDVARPQLIIQNFPNLGHLVHAENFGPVACGARCQVRRRHASRLVEIFAGAKDLGHDDFISILQTASQRV
jgi:hypothetical protein